MTALAAAPDSPDLQGLGLGQLIEAAGARSAAGDVRGAHDLYARWIEANPTSPLLFVVLFNCSTLDSALGDMQAAADSLRRAIEINPDFLPAYINLGGMLEKAESAEAAVALWSSAVDRPLLMTGDNVGHVVTALTQITRVLSEKEQIERAEQAVKRCLEISPNRKDLVEQYFALRLQQCKWPAAEGSERIDRKALLRDIHPLSMAAYTDDPMLQLAAANRLVAQGAFDSARSANFDRRHAPIDISKRRLRVGYISSDLRDHAVGYLMAELFEVHDTSRIEVFAYYCGPDSNSDLTQRTKANVEHWKPIRELSDDDAAQMIADDGIDILIDVNGHTRDARLGVFARRPAPIQVNWLGFPGTMGSPFHHYIIADDWIIPPSFEKYYSEKVLRLPCYQPNDRKRVSDGAPTRAENGLPDDAFVFCCFNGPQKFSRFSVERWFEILRRTPHSVLWLLNCPQETKIRLQVYAQAGGIDPARLIFAPKMRNQNHLARIPLADLFLDTVPYGAHTTASDALWMGVPLLTLSGRSFASRVCGSLVRSAGLPELVVDTPQAYVETAVALANDPAAIAAFKARLSTERDRCTLFDTDLLVRRLEALFVDMCRDYWRGALPRPDLSNLDIYLEAGVAWDHDQHEMLAVPDYDESYKRRLAQRHQSRPIKADTRLWSDSDIAIAEGAAHANWDDVKRALGR